MQELLEIMTALRDPERGCPWDRQQTFETIVPYTIEEAYEVADSIHRGDWQELRDELGDLLFQVVFYAQMAKEAGRFEFDDVVQAICRKMRRRHPHVFGDDQVADAEEQRQAWERHKAAERAAKAEDAAPPSRLDGVARALPALLRAHKLQRRAADVGFDWSEVSGVIAKVREELGEVEQALAPGVAKAELAAEVGDLLFSCVNLARHAGVDGETALREANRKFERRFRGVEARLAETGSSLEGAGLAEMDALWDQIKADEKGA